ncbi:MAG: LysR family transcriptional regulator, partial [Pseudolabrys sp.]
MNRLEAMSVVLAVAEAGSLSAAARRQKTPLATVSRKVSELEAHLQTKLFNRSTRALVDHEPKEPVMTATKNKGATVFTGPSTGIGAVQADLAKRAHDLVPVAILVAALFALLA